MEVPTDPKTPSTNKYSRFSHTSPLVLAQIAHQENIRKSRHYSFWGLINATFLMVVMYDINYACWQKVTYFQYGELSLATILIINIIFYTYKFFGIMQNLRKKPNVESKKLDLSSDCLDDSKHMYHNLVRESFSKAPVDVSLCSWMSTNSFNESQNVSSKSLSVLNKDSSPQNVTPKYTSLTHNSSNIVVEDEKSLNQYLKEFEGNESSNTTTSTEKPNLLSFFWNHPAAKMNKDSSPLLRRCQYQLSTPSSSSSSPQSDDKSSPLNKNSLGSDTWRRLNVDSVSLTQWNENLRIWISQTILYRLIKEIKSIDKSLHNQGLTDVTIGSVGLDRLRKTAQGQILQTTPNLATLVPFLELHPNQEYLVKRIKELAKGGCMSEYKWNGGSSHNGKDWETSLPTDAAIIMHLVATYLDIQLHPLPNKPDIKPFTGYHYIKSTDKLPTLTQNTLAIHEVTVNPPHYRVIFGLESYEIAKGYSNLFYSILLFLHQVNKKEHGMLGRVNLGRSGINLLWIIESN